MTPEGRVKNLICSWLSLQKCFFFVHDSVGIYDPVRKQFRTNKSPYRVKGVSDILGIWEGKFLAIEVKAGRNRPTEDQVAFIDTVNDRGGIGIIAWCLEDVQRALK